MDPTAVDRLSRTLVTTPSRRAALGAIAGALAGLLGRGSAPTEATAQARTCRRLGKACLPERGLDCCHGTCQGGRCRCRTSHRRCRGRCLPKRQCCRHEDCPRGRRCRQGRCQCPAGQRRCGGRCLPRDGCCRDGECGAHERCVNGRCHCDPNFKPCQGGCIADDACCGGCPGELVCIHGTCGAKRCGFEAPCRVFLTSTTYQGDLREGGAGSGIDGADAKCQERAQAGGLSGTYKAWLSGSTDASSPSQRFTNTANTGPYVRVDGTQVAASWADLTDGRLAAPISVTETGGMRTALVWTNTLLNGTAGGITPGAHCQEWTTAAGNPNFGNLGRTTFVDSLWSEGGRAACEVSVGLFCFEQG